MHLSCFLDRWKEVDCNSAFDYVGFDDVGCMFSSSCKAMQVMSSPIARCVHSSIALYRTIYSYAARVSFLYKTHPEPIPRNSHFWRWCSDPTSESIESEWFWRLLYATTDETWCRMSMCVTIRWWYGIVCTVYFGIPQRIPMRQRYTQYIDKPNMCLSQVRCIGNICASLDLVGNAYWLHGANLKLVFLGATFLGSKWRSTILNIETM